MGLASSGQLLEHSLAYLIHQADELDVSGVLDIHPVEPHAYRARFLFKDGRMILSHSADPYINLVTSLARLNAIDEEQQHHIYSTAHAGQQTVYDVIHAHYNIEPSILQMALELTALRACQTCLFAQGTFQFQQMYMSTSEDLPATVELSAPALLPRLFKKADTTILKPYIDRRAAQAYILTVPDITLPRWLDVTPYVHYFKQPTTIGEVLINTDKPESIYRDLAYLLTFGYLSATLKPAPIPQPTIPPTQGEDPFKKKPTVTNLDDYSEEHRVIVDDVYERLDKTTDANHYDILDVGRYATEEQIQRAYFGLARLYHQDRFATFDLRPAEEEARHKVFEAIQQAYHVLSDEEQRQEYSLKLDMEESGMSTDIGELFQAERNFENVQKMLSSGHLRAAAQLMTTILPVNPGNLEWKAYAIYTAWWNERNKFEAVESAKEISDILRQRPAIHQAAFFTGHLYLQAGEYKKAERYLKKIIAVDPEHRAALNAMKVLKRRRDEAEKNDSFIGRLFKR